MDIVKNTESFKEKQLVAAALSLFLSKGYHETRIEDIAAKAKVGKGTFYIYFKNKEALVEKLLISFMGEIKSTLAWVMDNVDEGANLNEVFLEEGLQLIRTMENNKKFAKFFFREGRSVSPKINKRIVSYTKEIVELSETTFAMAMAAKLIPVQNPKVCAVSVFGSIQSLYQYWLDGGFKDDDVEVEELMRQSIGFFIGALGIKGTMI